MNNKIKKVREDIRKAEARLREYEEYVKTLRMKERQLCDEEIAKTLREMTERGGDVMETLRKIAEGEQTENKEEYYD